MAPLVHFRMPSAFLCTLRLAQPAIEKRVLRAAEQDGQAGGQELTSRIPDYALLIHRLNGQASESRWPPGPLLSSLFCSGRVQPWFCLVVNWFI